MPTMPRTEHLGVRTTPGLRARLARLAVADGRSLSSLVEKILLEWLGRNEPQRGQKPREPARREEAGDVS